MNTPPKKTTPTHNSPFLAVRRVPALIVISGGSDRLDHTLAVIGALLDGDVTSIPDVSLQWGDNLATIVHGPGAPHSLPHSTARCR